MKLKSLKLFSVIFLLLSFSYSYSYNYTINDAPYFIENNSKLKVDTFVIKRITSITTANKYITALNKINPIVLASDKKNIYYYLKYRIYTCITDNTPVIVTQKPINTPITIPAITISNIDRIDTTSNLSASQKSYIDTLRTKVKEYVEVDKNYEFVEHGSYYRITFEKYFPIEWAVPTSYYIQEVPNIGNQILIRQWNEFMLTTWGYNIEKKYSIKDIANSVRFSWAWSWNVFFDVKNSYYYSYTLSEFKYHEIKNEWAYIRQLANIGNLSDNILIQQNGKYLLITWYTEAKLFNSSLLSNNENPLLILTSIWKDNYFSKSDNTEDIINRIKNKTNEITKNSNNNAEKISAIHSRITWNIAYDNYTTKYLDWKFSEAVYLSTVNKSVFSWLATFENKSWVCDWYSKLMQYMLSFAGITNATIESWKADIGKWKTVPHAWIKIDNLYYDPTWDVYSKWNSSKFKWFALTWTEIHKTHFVSQ